MAKHMCVGMTVNGTEVQLQTAVNRTLAELLREDLGLLGTKIGCDKGECGACTVIMNGRTVTSCLILAPQADGATVTTVEGIDQEGRSSAVIQAFIDEGAVQCGFCTPGMVVAAQALLDRNPQPSDADILEALEGNLCRCTGYQKIIRAVRKAGSPRR
jgi:carbon-monoxide dehydrogenase small subunit